MDGSNRQVLHSTGLVWPNGITLDYATRRVYWVDAFLDRIEHSFYNGTDRVTLISNLDHPFGLTIEGNLIFWTDWSDNSVRVAHKQLALGVQVLREFLRVRPYGIEAVTPTRQANGNYLITIVHFLSFFSHSAESLSQQWMLTSLSAQQLRSERFQLRLSQRL